MKSKYFITAVLMVTLAFMGCSSSSSSDTTGTTAATGGSGTGGTTATTGKTVIATGPMTKGSIIVGGIKFEDTVANIAADDTPKTAAFLDNGMMVKVKGTLNDDGITGKALEVQVENEVRGAITSKGTDTLVVNGQTVFADGTTVFANVANFAGLIVGDNIEVHGMRDTGGVIHATRIEKLGAGAAADEVRGVLGNLTATTFTIGSLTISYATATILPAGTTLANGMLVEVNLSGTNATKVKIEDAVDDKFAPAENDEFEVEGLISEFTAHPGSFKVNGKAVKTTATTLFAGGVSGDLANDIKVEAEGALSGGLLVAKKITFKANIKIEANADANGSVNALGLTVHATSKTEGGGLVGSITAGTGLKLRGSLNPDGSITATRVETQSAVAGNKNILQGPAVSVDAAAKTFKIAGITINASSVSADSVKRDDGTVIAIADFFSAISAKTVIVKARGTYAAGTITANELELEE